MAEADGGKMCVTGVVNQESALRSDRYDWSDLYDVVVYGDSNKVRELLARTDLPDLDLNEVFTTTWFDGDEEKTLDTAITLCMWESLGTHEDNLEKVRLLLADPRTDIRVTLEHAEQHRQGDDVDVKDWYWEARERFLALVDEHASATLTS
jgi:hypothetical protein